MGKKHLTILLVVLLTANIVIPVNVGGSISDMQQKIEKNQQAIKEINEQIKELNANKGEAESEIYKLDLELDKLNTEISNYETEIQMYNGLILESESEIENLTNEISLNNDALEQRLRIMYKNGVAGYMEVIFDSEDLIDALTRLDMVQRLVQSDVDLLKSIEDDKKQVEVKKQEQSDTRTLLQATQDSLVAKKNEVAVAYKEKEAYMASIENDIKAQQAIAERFQKESKELDQKIKELQMASEYAGGEMLWPAPGNYRITSHFGNREHPITGGRDNHGGTDISAPYNSKVVAANDGVVIMAVRNHWSYGNYVVIDHGGGISTLYAHNNKLLVTVGQKVTRGDQIALSGSTGQSTGPHVHFEVRVNGTRVDAEQYLK